MCDDFIRQSYAEVSREHWTEEFNKLAARVWWNCFDFDHEIDAALLIKAAQDTVDLGHDMPFGEGVIELSQADELLNYRLWAKYGMWMNGRQLDHTNTAYD